MKINIKIATVILLITGAFAFNGCEGGSGSGGHGTDLGNVTDLKTSNVGSIFTEVVKLQSSTSNRSYGRSSSSSSTFRTLSHINSKGNNEPIVFTTDTGNDVTLKITNVSQVNNFMIAFAYDGIIKVTIEEDGVVYDAEEYVWKQGLINFKTRKVYDISDYDIENILIDENYLFLLSQGTIYKIDLNDFTQAILRIPVKPATHSGFSLPPDGIFHFLDSALFKWQVSSRIF